MLKQVYSKRYAFKKTAEYNMRVLVLSMSADSNIEAFFGTSSFFETGS